MEWLIGIGIAAAAVVLLLIAGYVKSPPDTAYIISGFRKPRILIGKAGIRIPFLERLDKLSLKMFSVDVKTTDYVPNAEYINTYHVTFEVESGDRMELKVSRSEYGMLVIGDSGRVSFQGTRYLGFERG